MPPSIGFSDGFLKAYFCVLKRLFEADNTDLQKEPQIKKLDLDIGFDAEKFQSCFTDSNFKLSFDFIVISLIFKNEILQLNVEAQDWWPASNIVKIDKFAHVM